jgi:hypothetical protein
MVKFKDDISDLKTLENIKLIRLKYVPDDVIAFILQDETEPDPTRPRCFYIFDPAKILYMQPTPSGAALGLMEWVPYRVSNDEGFELSVSDVLFIADVDPGMKDMYLEYILKTALHHRVKKKNAIGKPPTFLAASNNEKQIVNTIEDLQAGQGIRPRNITDNDIQEKVMSGTFILPKKKSIN